MMPAFLLKLMHLSNAAKTCWKFVKDKFNSLEKEESQQATARLAFLFSGVRGERKSRNPCMTLRPPVEVHVERLKGLDYDILDVKSSRWHHDYNHFKSGAKDL
jgi:hypothetical protein